jgi:hypothetical protein
MTARLEFAKRHLKDVWSDETKIELFVLNAKCAAPFSSSNGYSGKIFEKR